MASGATYFFFPAKDAYVSDFAPSSGSTTASLLDTSPHFASDLNYTFYDSPGADNNRGTLSLYLPHNIAGTFPISCGYQNPSVWHLCERLSGGVGISSRFKLHAGSWTGVGFRDYDDLPASGTQWNVNPPSVSVSGPIDDLVGTIEIGIRNGDGFGKSTGSMNCYEMHFGIEVLFDTLAPSIPSSIKIDGYSYPISVTDYPASNPILSARYKDGTNATNGDKDESSWVYWQVGSATAAGPTITDFIVNASFPTVVSVTDAAPVTFMHIAWPASTYLDPTQTYFFRCKVADANSNVSAWSSIFEISGFGQATWWNNNWTRRALITFGTNHEQLNPLYTQGVSFNSGVFKTLSNKGFLDESSGGGQGGIYRRGHRTFLGFRGREPGIRKGHVYIGYYDHNTKSFGAPVSIHEVSYTDLHYGPSIYVDSEGYVHVIVGSHGGAQPYYKSTATFENSFNKGSPNNSNIGYGTYPRIVGDPTNGDIYIFWRKNMGLGIYGRSYRRSTDNGTNWGTLYHYAYYNDAVQYSSSIYSAGPFIDNNGIIHDVLAWDDAYGNVNGNYWRGVSYCYSPDRFNWYALDGSAVGSTTISAGASNINWASCQPVFAAQASDFPTPGPYYISNEPNLHVTDTGTVMFATARTKKFGVGEDYNLSFTQLAPVHQCFAISQAGSTWATFDLCTLTSTPSITRHRNGNCLQIFDDGSTNKIINVFAGVFPAGEEYFGAETVRFSSNDYGITWSVTWLTKNSAYGQPIITGYPGASLYDRPYLLFSRMSNMEFYDGSNPTTTFLPNADDIRIVYGTKEIDRLPANFWSYSQTTILFAIQATINTNSNIGPKPYYLYYGNYFAAATGPKDHNNIFPHYEGFETYPTYAVPTNHGWNVNTAGGSPA